MFIDFFAGFEAVDLILLVAGGIYAILQVFVPQLSPIAWLKGLLKWTDLQVQILVQGFFFILSGLAMWVTGELALSGFTLKVLMVYFGTWYGWSQLAWQTLKVIRK